MNIDSRIVYRVNNQDEIIYTNQKWSQFAVANSGEAIVSEWIIGRSLWDFIADETTRHLYQKILRQARRGDSARFVFRCDSADCRRFLEMSISNLGDGEVQFETYCLRVESRQSQKLLESDAPRSGEMLSMCAWCNRIGVSAERWEEVEKAVETLGLFEQETLPPISHGMCKDCYQRITESIVK